MFNICNEKKAIQPVESACSNLPPVGKGSDLLKIPMLSKPKNPPSNTLLPSWSFLLTHHVKFKSNFWNTLSKKSSSDLPYIFFSSL
ncbi:hypothetical protein WICPIJ_001994 [Wickerhamomyces pijperi]|uniref:Uncharacterized protein n=1 Tax=Wickerhamomyces pijperi TaxID=599730 RepID=A0A9P8QAJ7_WICPI|nr:hypothetical protein WICPIJ_001994 [Wickerhamomyces pijperi]